MNVAGPSNTAINAINAINASLSVTKAQVQSVYAVNFLASVEPFVVADDLTLPAAGKIYTAIAIGSATAGAANPLTVKLITDK